MDNQVDVVATVGTWVAAGVAIIALIGVAGPILVWRASRTERHRALDALSERGAKSFGYVSKGLRVTPSIRLFRRIKAPEIRQIPSFSVKRLTRKQDMPVIPDGTAGWVQFGVLL